MKNKPISAHIATLDPLTDHKEIAFLLSCHSFWWDTEKALEFALFRTFAVPSISKLLSETGEFRRRPRKRYDDTELIMYEILENGYDSPQAARAFRRMNDMHRRFNISNEDFLYVLSTFLFMPIYWNEKYGWRKLIEGEKLAAYFYYKEVGKRMNIKDIPESYEAFEAFHIQFEKEHFRFAETNREIGTYTTNLLLGMYVPKFLFFLGRPIVHSLMDAPLCEAMGIKRPPRWLRGSVYGLMRLRAAILRRLPERKKPYLGTQARRPTYPEGYKIEELGTFG